MDSLSGNASYGYCHTLDIHLLLVASKESCHQSLAAGIGVFPDDGS